MAQRILSHPKGYLGCVRSQTFLKSSSFCCSSSAKNFSSTFVVYFFRFTHYIRLIRITWRIDAFRALLFRLRNILYCTLSSNCVLTRLHTNPLRTRRFANPVLVNLEIVPVSPRSLSLPVVLFSRFTCKISGCIMTSRSHDRLHREYDTKIFLHTL